MKYSLILLVVLVLAAGCHSNPAPPKQETWTAPQNFAVSVNNAKTYLPAPIAIDKCWQVTITSPVTPITLRIYNKASNTWDTYTTPVTKAIPPKTTLMVIPIVPTGYVYDSWNLVGNAYTQNTMMTWTAPANDNPDFDTIQTLEIIVAPSAGG